MTKIGNFILAIITAFLAYTFAAHGNNYLQDSMLGIWFGFASILTTFGAFLLFVESLKKPEHYEF